MKKLMALLVATLMIISVLPSVAFAEADADVQAVYDALTEEMLVTDNEPESSVTKNLNLDLTGDITLPAGVSVTFASSDETIIAADGTVTRDVNTAKEVTLTATISKEGAESLTKELNFIVLPLTQDVIVSDNLYYPQHTGKLLIDYSSGKAVHTIPQWSLSNHNATMVTDHLEARYSKDANGYYGATATRHTGTNEMYFRFKPTTPDIIQGADDKSVTYSINFNPVNWGTTNTKQFYLRFYGNTNSTYVSYIQFWSTQTRIVDSKGTTELFKTTAHKVKTNENNNVTVKFDYNANLMYVTLNGTLLTPNGVPTLATNLTKQFSHFDFGYFRQMTDSVFQINDVTITRETKYKVRNVNEITAELIADGQIPSFITEDLDLPANTEITWTSTNPDVISAEGTVIRPALEDAVVTLTANDGTNTKSVQFTVKALTVSGVGVNYSFDNTDAKAGVKPAMFTDSVSGKILYAKEGNNTYLDYTGTAGFDATQSSMNINTGTDFPVGSLGKYIIEYDAKYNNVQHAMVTILANGARAVRLNNYLGALKVGVAANTEWYGADNKTYANVTANEWHKFRFEIDTTKATTLVDIYMNDALIASGVAVEGSSYNTSIGIEFRTRDASADAPSNMKIDNLRIYTTSTPDEALKLMSNQDKINYFEKFITLDSIGGTKYYDLTENLTLDAPFESFDLADYGVSVNWESNNESVVSSSGVVTKTEVDYTRSATLTATLTAGTGEDAVTSKKEFIFTILADNSKEFGKASMTFDDGSVNGWVGTSNSSVQTVTLPGRNGKVLEQTFTGVERGYTRSASLGGGTLKNVYSISTDVMFQPDSSSTKQCFEVLGASYTSRITFNFSTGAIGVQGDFGDRYFMVPGIKAETNRWYHIDIVFNAKQKNYMPYINGQALLEEPVDVADNVWAGWLYVRNAGFYSYGTGKIYVDNFYIRESLSEAAPLDPDSDYTIRKIALYNETNNSAITNPAPDAKAIIAKVKVLSNRPAQDGEGKILFVRYSPDNKLQQIVSEPLTSKNGANEVGGAIINVTMPLEGDCSDDTFKVFVFDSDSLKAYCKNTDSTGPKFDTEKLFNMDMNVTLASDLGYYAESKYDGIDAIIYDGDTYLGRKTKHFAYIGLPEGASAENPVPAVVCVHGGGGSAYDEWVKLWNDAGYAAIAMNLNGRIPTPEITDGNNQLRHMWAGATQDNYGTVSPDDATWMYSAVTAVIGAHNVLRDMPEVDNSKIGVTGVSWGGVVTSTTIGVDDRFAFAIPTYGCGFLMESETYMGQILPRQEKLWDPSIFFKNADLPVFWFNGERDANFSLTSTTKSSLALGDNSYTAIVPGFGHSHAATWQRKEPIAFANSIVKNGPEFIRGEAVLEGSTVTVTTNRPAVKAVLRYITTDLSYTSTTNSTTLNFTFADCTTTDANTDTFTFTLPEGTKHYYVTFTDSDGNVTSTVLYDVK